MGIALIIEGFMSAFYHICPTNANFQFGELLSLYPTITYLLISHLPYNTQIQRSCSLLEAYSLWKCFRTDTLTFILMPFWHSSPLLFLWCSHCLDWWVDKDSMPVHCRLYVYYLRFQYLDRGHPVVVRLVLFLVVLGLVLLLFVSLYYFHQFSIGEQQPLTLALVTKLLLHSCSKGGDCWSSTKHQVLLYDLPKTQGRHCTMQR